TADESRDVQHDQGTEHDGYYGEWVGAPPQQRERQGHGKHESDGPPRDIRAQEAFADGSRHQHGDQEPVPPLQRRRLRNPRYGPQRPNSASHQHPSLKNAGGSASAESTRRPPPDRPGDDQPPRPMCPIRSLATISRIRPSP